MEKEFTVLLKDTDAILKHLLMKIGPSSAYERADVRQDILLNAWRSFPQFRHEAKFTTWFYKIGILTVFQYYRKQRTELNRAEFTYEVHTKYVQHPNELSTLSELKALLGNDLDALIFNLYVADYTYSEIAEQLGISLSYVGVKVHRIKGKLRKALKTSPSLHG